MDILLTFTGFHDPYSKGLIDQEEQPGPILSLLSTRSFHSIYLFDTPSTHKITQETKKAISSLHCNTEVKTTGLLQKMGSVQPVRYRTKTSIRFIFISKEYSEDMGWSLFRRH